MESSFEMVIE